MTDKPKKKLALRGATKPRLQSVPLKGKNKLDDVKQLCEIIKMPLLPWQEHVLKDMLTVDSKGKWIRKTNLLLIARQNGKTHLARMLILAHLIKWETNVLIMSSNRSMALDTFRQVTDILENNDHLKGFVKQIRYANGTESIEMLNGTRLDVVAATRDGSRGRSVNGLLFIDEVREISEEGFRAATPVTRAHPNSHTLLCSNAGDAFSTVLNDLRERAISYPPKSFGFYEYSAPQYCKIDDRNAWAMANPSLGYTITEEALEEAIATSPIENTRTETLCQWIDSLSSPWPHGILEETSDSTLEMTAGAYTVFGFDVSPSRRNGSLVAGQILPDGRIGIGILETYSSQVAIDELKMAASIKGWADIYKPRLVCFDKYATQTIADRLSQSGVMVEDVSGQQFYKACGDLLEGLVNHRVVHNGQAELIQQMNNCAAKVNDSAWRIIKRKSAGDISAPIGLAMVVSKLMLPQPKPQIYT
ncbi:Terminase large subunit, Lambdalikevirus-type [uncultured Caudovirales phage]|uniref:Terminase large subunit, Lambdalikevirus-type n=1 Tax=uncultured Caudovirales phage TaxID=2100421 RepID=A0A6J5NGY9_9CAUD|nr:Terminase large subunit, Lambdalikevirus-type [uncultured Caudovirales phage]